MTKAPTREVFAIGIFYFMQHALSMERGRIRRKPYRRVDTLERAGAEAGQARKDQGVLEGKVKLFRVVVYSDRAEWIVTKDPAQDSAQGTREVRAARWKIEEFYREAEQLTGIVSCQCRARRIQRNRIAYALLVWTRLKRLTYQSGRTIYRIKRACSTTAWCSSSKTLC